MKVETKEDALLHCFALWLWLAMNPGDKKSEWPGWVFNGGDVEKCLFNCPCCEVYWQNCSNCPIAWNDDANDSFRCRCENTDSPFFKWLDTGRRSKYAMQIAVKAMEALYDLYDGKEHQP